MKDERKVTKQETSLTTERTQLDQTQTRFEMATKQQKHCDLFQDIKNAKKGGETRRVQPGVAR